MRCKRQFNLFLESAILLNTSPSVIEEALDSLKEVLGQNNFKETCYYMLLCNGLWLYFCDKFGLLKFLGEDGHHTCPRSVLFYV